MKKVSGPQVVTSADALESPLPPAIEEALGELFGAAREGLLALSVGVGLGVVHELMEAEVRKARVRQRSGARSSGVRAFAIAGDLKPARPLMPPTGAHGQRLTGPPITPLLHEREATAQSRRPNVAARAQSEEPAGPCSTREAPVAPSFGG